MSPGFFAGNTPPGMFPEIAQRKVFIEELLQRTFPSRYSSRIYLASPDFFFKNSEVSSDPDLQIFLRGFLPAFLKGFLQEFLRKFLLALLQQFLMRFLKELLLELLQKKISRILRKIPLGICSGIRNRDSSRNSSKDFLRSYCTDSSRNTSSRTIFFCRYSSCNFCWNP